MKTYLTLKNLGWLLTAVLTIVLGMSGVSKLIGTEEMVKNFTYMNLSPYMTILGIVELLGVILLILPKTSKYGAVLLSSYLSGAVAMHLSVMGGVGVVTPIILGMLVWSAHCTRTYTTK